MISLVIEKIRQVLIIKAGIKKKKSCQQVSKNRRMERIICKDKLQ